MIRWGKKPPPLHPSVVVQSGVIQSLRDPMPHIPVGIFVIICDMLVGWPDLEVFKRLTVIPDLVVSNRLSAIPDLEGFNKLSASTRNR